MIRRKEECRTEIREHMRGGDGSVIIENLFEKEELLGHSRMFSRIILEPGCSVGMHGHEGEEELFYIIKGDPLYYDDDKEVQLHEGDVTICEDGHSHSICNRTDETIYVVACIILK